jgi:hypothetical protein
MLTYDKYDYAVSRLLNLGGAAEGTNLAPPLSGEGRVAPVSNFRVLNTQQLPTATVYFLGWMAPEDQLNQIAYYNIYATDIVNNVTQNAPIVAAQSPARVEFETKSNSVIVFTIQTVLKNGLASDLSYAPSCVGSFAAQSLTPAAGSITPAMLSTSGLIIPNLVLTNNSPGAGQVSWNSFTIYYGGNAYSISSGNTTGTEQQIYWDLGNSTLSFANSFTPNINRFPIATNSSGTADTSWNKVGTVAIQRPNMAFPLLEGFAIQNPSLNLAGNITFTLNGPSSIGANLLTVNQEVVIISSRIIVDTPYTVNCGAGGAVTTRNLYLQIICDGVTAQNIPIIDTITTLGGGGTTAPVDFNEALLCYQSNDYGTGGHTAGDWVAVQFGISCRTSLAVNLVATDSDTSVNLGLTMAGQMRISLGYALKV